MRLPEHRTENAFSEFKAPFSPAAAHTEATRCLYCFEAPCIPACPCSIDIPNFIRKIATGNLKAAARTIFEDNVHGMSCARVCPTEVLCAGECVLPRMGLPAIQIGRLQRFATDLAYEKKWSFFHRAAPTGRKVALLGAGPASLACAHELARLGHDCVIFEKRHLPGGLNTMGIAPYKMKADRAVEEAEWILSIGGIEVRYGTEVGKDVSLQELESGFDAVFVGVGLGEDRWLSRLRGHDLPGVRGATDYIEDLKTGTVTLDGVRSAVVLGAGNTAVDAVRELKALGVPEVTMAYRRGQDAMKGYAHEWSVAVQQGVKAAWYAVPVAFEGTDRVTGVRFQRVGTDLQPLGEPPFVLDADLVLLAIGQAGIVDFLAGLDGVRIDGDVVLVDEHRFTGRPGWYAGGDCVNGGREVVNASADGLKAARSIHNALAAR